MLEEGADCNAAVGPRWLRARIRSRIFIFVKASLATTRPVLLSLVSELSDMRRSNFG